MSWMPALDSFEGVAGVAAAPMLALSALEWQVIGLAIREAGRLGGGIRAASRWRRFVSLITGNEMLRPLADPRLETLRSFVCAVRNGHRLAERFACRLLEFGFTRDQIGAVRLLAAR